MKKVLLMLMLVVTAVCFLAACNDKPSDTQNQDFVGILFEDQTIDYDGEEHTIIATGVPEGASVVYTNAGPYKNAGEYEIGLKVTKDGYNDYTKTATLKINKINFSGITFSDVTVDYDGENRVAACILKLNERQQNVLILKHHYGYDLREIAKILNISYRNALQIEQRAKAKLRALCEEEGILC